MTTFGLGKTKAVTRWIFVSKVMSLLFKMLSRFVIAFLPRSECLIISCLQSPTAIILEPKKKKCKKAKWLYEEALQIAVKRREVKAKEKRKDINI